MSPDPTGRCGVRVSTLFEPFRLCGKPAVAKVTDPRGQVILFLCPEHRSGWTPGAYSKVEELST